MAEVALPLFDHMGRVILLLGAGAVGKIRVTLPGVEEAIGHGAGRGPFGEVFLGEPPGLIVRHLEFQVVSQRARALQEQAGNLRQGRFKARGRLRKGRIQVHGAREDLAP